MSEPQTERGSAVTADAHGLRTRSRRFGEQRLSWSELRDVGWVRPPKTQKAATGLAVRRREGGAYDPGGPHIPGWVARPVGVDEADIDALRRLAEQAGVVWRDYRATDVMEPPRP